MRIKDMKLSWIQTLAINILKSGPVPKHIGIIMDGNRRWAKANKLPRLVGHMTGYNNIMDVYQWCVALGVKVVTLFALSVSNLDRSKDEIESLWNMTESGFEDLIEQKEDLKKLGIRIQVIGELSILPKKLHKILADAINMTKENNKAIINFAVPYASKHELTNAVKNIVKGVETREILLDDISKEMLSACLYTGHLPDPDLIIRTSGEVRLSEFLLWQTSCSCLYFTEVPWPVFSFWNMLAAMFYYQRCYVDLNSVRLTTSSLVLKNDNDFRIRNFVNELHKRRECMLEKVSQGLPLIDI